MNFFAKIFANRTRKKKYTHTHTYVYIYDQETGTQEEIYNNIKIGIIRTTRRRTTTK